MRHAPLLIRGPHHDRGCQRPVDERRGFLQEGPGVEGEGCDGPDVARPGADDQGSKVGGTESAVNAPGGGRRRPNAALLPAQGSKRLGTEEFMAGMAAIPLAERLRIDLTEAITRIMVRKYPCAR